MRTLADAFLRYVDDGPDIPALTAPTGIGASETLTRKTLAERVARWTATYRTSRVAPGDRILLLAACGADVAAAFWAAQIIGSVAVPAPCLERGRRSVSRIETLQRLCAIARPKLIVCGTSDAVALAVVAGFPPALTQAAPDAAPLPQAVPMPEDLAVIRFTSGSTQAPKGCALTHRAVLSNACAIAQRTGAEPGDIGVCRLPLHHDMGLMSGIVVPVASLASSHLLNTAIDAPGAIPRTTSGKVQRALLRRRLAGA